MFRFVTHFISEGSRMSAINDLTKQESIVLALVAQGKRNAQIARELYLSVHTIETHLYRIFQKLDVSSRTEAAIYALQNGLFSTPNVMGTADDSQEKSNYYEVIR
jgi:DNA-binding NarL/FixJ family response regulator